MVTNMISEELRAQNLRIRQVPISPWDADVTWYELSRIGSPGGHPPKGARTYEFLDWNRLEYFTDPQRALIEQLKRLVFSR